MSVAASQHTAGLQRASAEFRVNAPRLACAPRTEALTPFAVTLGLLMWAGIFAAVWALL